MKFGLLRILSTTFVLLGGLEALGQSTPVCDEDSIEENAAAETKSGVIEYTFDKFMEIPSEYDDNFAYAVIAVSAEQKALIARNYIRVGSSQNIDWLEEHPERRGNRLFTLDSNFDKPAHLVDSTTFGFIPDSTLAYVMTCASKVKMWDTRTQEKLDIEFSHAVANECAGPAPAISPAGRLMATQTADALQFWDLRTFEAITPPIRKDWSWDMQFSPDGRWFFHRSDRELSVRNPENGELVAGPFRHDVIENGFAYNAGTQQLVTHVNNDKNEDIWKCVLVIRSGDDWSGERKIELTGHTREAHWVDDNHLLIVSDEKRDGAEPPYTYGKNTVSLVSFGDQDWVLLHQEQTASVCSLATGQELQSWNDVATSRVDGNTIWLCKEDGVEVLRATPSNE